MRPVLASTLALALTAVGAPQNIVGTELQTCSTDPMTGWFRDGACRTDPRDRGTHVVCAEVTAEFLRFGKSKGNDLVTPSPEHRFPGLEPGDRWCLCALRWLEAHRAGKAPPVVPAATHEKAMELVPKSTLLEAATLSGSTPD